MRRWLPILVLGLVGGLAAAPVQSVVLNLCPPSVCLGTAGDRQVAILTNGTTAATFGTDQSTTLAGDLTVSGDVTATGNITATDQTFTNATIGGTLDVTGATTLGSTLGLTGVGTFDTDLGVGGDLTVTGDLSVTGVGSVVWGKMSSAATVNASTTLTTPSALDALTFSIGASEIWRAWYVLGISGATAADIKINFEVPSGEAHLINAECLATGVDDDTSNFGANRFDTIGTTHFLCDTKGVGTYYFIVAQGYFENGATPGTISVSFAQNSSTGSDTTIGTNSSVYAVRVQ